MFEWAHTGASKKRVSRNITRQSETGGRDKWNRIFREKCSAVDSCRCKISLLTVTQRNAPDISRNVFTCSQLSSNDSEETTTLLHTRFLTKKTIIFSWSRRYSLLLSWSLSCSLKLQYPLTHKFLFHYHGLWFPFFYFILFYFFILLSPLHAPLQ
jgi:hypothetical protein